MHEIDALALKEGDRVTIKFDAFAGETFTGTIADIGSQAENKPQLSNATYFPVIITFDTLPDRTLFPGMSVRIIKERAHG